MSEQADTQQDVWRVERMYGERDTVLWAVVTGTIALNEGPAGDFRVVGSFLRESDALTAVSNHNAAARLARAEQALRAAEWTEHSEEMAADGSHCGVCYRMKDEGHARDCVVRAALEEAGGA